MNRKCRRIRKKKVNRKSDILEYEKAGEENTRKQEEAKYLSRKVRVTEERRLVRELREKVRKVQIIEKRAGKQ